MAENALNQKRDPRGEMQATPRNRLMGYLADAMGSANAFATQMDPRYANKRQNQTAGILADAVSLGSLAKTADRMSYGEPLTNARQANVPFLKPETADALMMAPLSPRNALAAASMGIGMADNGAMQAMSFASKSRNIFGSLPPELLAKAQAELAELAAKKSATAAKPLSAVDEPPFSPVLLNGKPRTFYHGTSGDHTSLSDAYQGSVSSGDGVGHWFAHDPKYAWEYAENAAGKRGGAPRIVRANLSAKNTLEVGFNGQGQPTINGAPVGFKENSDVLKYAKDNGFDSVNFPDGSFTDDPSFVVLRGDQAKFIK